MKSRFAPVRRAILLGAAAVAVCCAADLFPIAGVVVNAGTNSPLPHARVSLYPSGATTAVARAITGDDGRFQFQLPAGSYRMRAGTRDTWENYGARHPGNSLGSAVIVGPGKDTASLVFRFYPPAAITGRIADDSGEPVPNALVQLIRANVVSGIRAPAVLAYQRTNDLGEYRFGELPGDSPYYIDVSGEPWYTQSARPDAPGTQAAAAYASVYYPGTPDPSKATSIIVKPGEEARADFTMRTVANAAVTIRHDAPAGMKGTVSLTCDGVAGTTAFQQTQQLSTGFQAPDRGPQIPAKQVQVLPGVPPGHYVLKVRGVLSGRAFTGTAPVDVNGANVTVEISLRPEAKIEGTVRLAPGAASGKGLRIAIAREGIPGLGTTSVRGDGSFSFPAVEPGQLRVTVSPGFFISQMTARGGTIQGEFLDVSENIDVALSLTVSDQTGNLSGFVVDGDRPLEGVLAVLAPVPGQFIIGQPRVYQTESDGSFNFRSVPAGRYRLFAVDEAEFEYARPDVVAPYLPGAREIEIRPGTPSNERIPLTRPHAR